MKQFGPPVVLGIDELPDEIGSHQGFHEFCTRAGLKTLTLNHLVTPAFAVLDPKRLTIFHHMWDNAAERLEIIQSYHNFIRVNEGFGTYFGFACTLQKEGTKNLISVDATPAATHFLSISEYKDSKKKLSTYAIRRGPITKLIVDIEEILLVEDVVTFKSPLGNFLE